jgi:hypothetical protein
VTAPGENLTTILATDFLYRRLNLKSHFRKDGSVSSRAFMYDGKPDEAVSVDLARLTTPHESLARETRSGWCLGELSASVPLDELGLEVLHVPLEDNFSHAEIRGLGPDDMMQGEILASKVQRVPNLPPT